MRRRGAELPLNSRHFSKKSGFPLSGSPFCIKKSLQRAALWLKFGFVRAEKDKKRGE
jgi:hypothetical protein